MKPPSGSQRRSEREKRRVALAQRLLDAVERLADDDEAFTTIGIERIVAEAGAGRSTFYLYFQDKSELMEAWYAPIASEITDAYASWTALTEAPTRQELRTALETILDVRRAHASALSIIYEATAYDPIIRERVGSVTDEVVDRLAKHVRLGKRRGWVRDDVLPRETATWLAWMGQRGAQQLLRLDDDARYSEFLDGFLDVVWRSLYARAAVVAA